MSTQHLEALIATAEEAVTRALGPAPVAVDRSGSLRGSIDVAGRIDHTLLHPEATQTDILHLCHEAIEHEFASVCVNSRWVPTAAETLQNKDVMVCSVVGFPLGAMTRLAKAREAAIAVDEGANEIDMVIDLGGLLSGDLAAVYEDMLGVADAAARRPVKVIIETCLLSDAQKVIACLIALRTPVAYVKTSTGFSGGGATVDDVALMRTVVGDDLGVKASGGIHTLAEAEAMITAGADRLGTSSGLAIVTGSEPDRRY
jgi:deoxyribose-phosphate aldolase